MTTKLILTTDLQTCTKRSHWLSHTRVKTVSCIRDGRNILRRTNLSCRFQDTRGEQIVRGILIICRRFQTRPNRRNRAGSQICPSCVLLPLPTCPFSHWTHRPPQNDLPLCDPWRFSHSYFGQDGQLKCLSTCISLAHSLSLTASILLHYVELLKGDDCDRSFSS